MSEQHEINYAISHFRHLIFTECGGVRNTKCRGMGNERSGECRGVGNTKKRGIQRSKRAGNTEERAMENMEELGEMEE
jgi:hypothetical protein